MVCSITFWIHEMWESLHINWGGWSKTNCSHNVSTFCTFWGTMHEQMIYGLHHTCYSRCLIKVCWLKNVKNLKFLGELISHLRELNLSYDSVQVKHFVQVQSVCRQMWENIYEHIPMYSRNLSKLLSIHK
jgi:hypothetical protein